MKIAVIGSGYVGLMQAAGLADVGYDVLCIDIDKGRVDRLKRGELPIYEPGLGELVTKHVGARLQFTADYADLKDTDLFFICVQTPQLEDGTCDTRYVEAALSDVGGTAKPGALAVIKSTVPPGTLERFKSALNRSDVRVAVNPEFLREGTSVNDFFHPYRTVVGVERHEDADLLREVYRFIDAPFLAMNIPSAQMVKYASNTMLALRLSYINEIANIAQATGGHIKDIEQAVGMDPRIGSDFLRSGAGFGGSCFPKDVLALHVAGVEAGYTARLIAPIIDINNDQPGKFIDQLHETIHLEKGQKIAVWGLAFNKGTDDVRQSPAIKIVRELLARGVHVVAHDPQAMQNAHRELEGATGTEHLRFVAHKEEALASAEALLVLTEWDEYIAADFDVVKEKLARPVIGDGKHSLNHWVLRKSGFNVVGIGL